MQRLLSLNIKRLVSNCPKNAPPTNQTQYFSSSLSRHVSSGTWTPSSRLPISFHRHFSSLWRTKTSLDSQIPTRAFHSSYSSRRGWKSWFQYVPADEFVLGLIVANAAVFVLWRIADQRFMLNHFTISIDNVLNWRLHSLITSAFSHVDTEHIISNMIGLYFFGTSIARSFGPDYLLKLYLAGAIGGSVFYLIHQAFLTMSSENQGPWMKDPSKTPALGASGAVNAILLLNILLNPRATLYFDFIIPVPAALLGIFLIGKDILRIIEGNTNISGSAHLGGAAVALIAWSRLRRGRRF